MTARPRSGPRPPGRRARNPRLFWLACLLVALSMAGFASHYASSRPDGLMYVAEQAGFANRAEDSPAANGRFADYGTRGVRDARLGGGIAGVAGALTVLGLTGGLVMVLRRRKRS